MKKRGFTVVEFAISFCLIAAVALLLFELILSLKTLYLNGNIKSTLLSKQGIMLQRINDDYDNNFLKSVTSCGISCLTFTYTTPENTIKTTTLEIDPHNKTITYDDYTMLLDAGNAFGDINTSSTTIDSITSTNVNNSILTIHIPIHNNLLNEDFDIKINLPYKSSTTVINTRINIDDVDIVLDDMTIPVVTLSGRDGYFAEIFYHDVAINKDVFTSLDEFKRSEIDNKRSALFSLDLFKGKYNNNLNTDVFEFVLMYPSYSTTEANHWYQTNNFLKNSLQNPLIHPTYGNAWNNKWDSYGHFVGLNKVDLEDECGFVSTNDIENEKCYTTIGAKKLINNKFMFNQNGTDLSATNMKLYVRCDDFIDKYALSNVIK